MKRLVFLVLLGVGLPAYADYDSDDIRQNSEELCDSLIDGAFYAHLEDIEQNEVVDEYVQELAQVGFNNFDALAAIVRQTVAATYKVKKYPTLATEIGSKNEKALEGLMKTEKPKCTEAIFALTERELQEIQDENERQRQAYLDSLYKQANLDWQCPVLDYCHNLSVWGEDNTIRLQQAVMVQQAVC